jgi:hypothetical protein
MDTRIAVNSLGDDQYSNSFRLVKTVVMPNWGSLLVMTPMTVSSDGILGLSLMSQDAMIPNFQPPLN